MNNSLYNKIYLGRRAAASRTRGMAALAVLGTVAGAGLFWLFSRTR